jgi:hypothetical protein
VLDIAHDNPSADILRFLLQQDFLTVQRSVPCVRIRCVLSMCSQGTNKSISNSFYRRHEKLWTPLNFCTLCCGVKKRFSQEVVRTIYTAYMCEQRGILILLITHLSSKDLVSSFWPESWMLKKSDWLI